MIILSCSAVILSHYNNKIIIYSDWSLVKFLCLTIPIHSIANLTKRISLVKCPLITNLLIGD